MYKLLPEDKRDGFFELVLYPAKASAIVNELYITAGKNRLYATQGRASANDLAQQTRSLFAADAALSDEYNHKLAGGKWDHMMDQTHIGYSYWQEPRIDVMPAVSEVHPLARPYMQVAVEGSTKTNESWAARLELPEFDVFNQQRRSIDLFNSGDQTFEYAATADKNWIHIDEPGGTVANEKQLWVSVDWNLVPVGESSGSVLIQQRSSAEGRARVARVLVRAFKPSSPERDKVDGFVEANHYVSIEAEHFTARTSANSVSWEKIPGFGETLSGMTVFPMTAPSAELAQPAPVLEYRMYLFEGGSFNVEATLAPTLNFVPGRGLRYAVSFDDQAPVIVDALEQNTDKDWSKAVSDGVRRAISTVHVDGPGYHTLKFRMVDAGVVLEKLVVSQGKVPTSYLGPPESYRGVNSQGK